MTTTINASNTGSGGLIQTADASGILALQTAGTTAVTVDTSQNVGVGTASPSTKFHVAGAAAIARVDRTADASANPELQLTAVGRQFNVGVGGATFATTALQGSYYILDSTAGSYRLTINVNGYVGIQTTTPAAPLQVGPSIGSGSINGYTRFLVESTDYAVTTMKAPAANFSQIIFTDPTSTNLGGINFFNSTNATPNAIAFLTGGGNERLRIDSSGRVGIGTASPAYKLDVNGDVNVPSDSSYFLGANADRYLKYRSGNNDILLSSFSGLFYQQSVGSLYHTWFTGNNERARINAFGLGLGGTAASSGTGIAFPATQNPSSDANTLDDYEEGTFTPNVVNSGSSSTWSSKQGWYRKVGSLITCWITCDGGNSGTGGTALQVTGLPFTLFSGPPSAQCGGIWAANGLAANNGGLDPQGGTTVSNIYIGGGIVTSQTTYFSCCLTFMTSA
jgi:hypothetical protein